jgi:hypothetical protein
MTSVVKKLSISSELAQTMVDEAVAKARELGVTENALPRFTLLPHRSWS